MDDLKYRLFEFWLLYGWAIFIIIVVVIALYVMGIFNPTVGSKYTIEERNDICENLCTDRGLKLDTWVDKGCQCLGLSICSTITHNETNITFCEDPEISIFKIAGRW